MFVKRQPLRQLKNKDFHKLLNINANFSNFVDPLGLEPRMAGPKPAVLPITPWVKMDSKIKINLALII